MSEKILITGGSGLVGTALTELLISQGYQISILSRKLKENTEDISWFKWNVENKSIDKQAVLEADYIIHLAGENVANSRWSKKRKQEIIDSRVQSTELIHSVLSNNTHKLKAFISASATGIYGTKNSDNIFKEEDNPGEDFLASVCKKWEASVDLIGDLGIRIVKLRTGVVLSKEGGALQKMLFPIEIGFGSAIGYGKQYMPWVHIDDLCLMYLLAINNAKLEGAFNAVTGDDLTNKKLGQSIANGLNKPFFMPNVPSFVLKLIFGEMSVILLQGSQVSSDKIKNAGFVFKHKTIEVALQSLLKIPRYFED